MKGKSPDPRNTSHTDDMNGRPIREKTCYTWKKEKAHPLRGTGTAGAIAMQIAGRATDRSNVVTFEVDKKISRPPGKNLRELYDGITYHYHRGDIKRRERGGKQGTGHRHDLGEKPTDSQEASP